ncbi:hypothetical protein KEM54_006854 [Ascosphaera aggregata]|nr:hypothetical protein KEM54_006854 [Ascosphaera aggregata]
MSPQGSTNDEEIRVEEEVNVNIVSPSAGVPDNFVLKNVKLTETVLGLKQRLNNELESHPTPSDQRLIYRGKPLLNDSDTLKTILRFDLCGPTKTPSIHLVLPPKAPEITAPSSDGQPQRPNSLFSYANLPSSLARSSLSHSNQTPPIHPTGASTTASNEDTARSGHTTEPSGRSSSTVRDSADAIHLPGTVAPGSSLEAEADSRTVAEAVFLPAGTQSRATPGSVEANNSVQSRRAELARRVFSIESRVRAGETVLVETLTQLQHEVSQLRSGPNGDTQVGNDRIPDFLLARLQTLIHIMSGRANQSSGPTHNEQSTSSPNEGRASQLERPWPSQTCVYLLRGPNGYQALLTPPREGNTSSILQFTPLVPQHILYNPHMQSRNNIGLHPNPLYPASAAYTTPLQLQSQHSNYSRMSAAQRARQLGARADAHRRPRRVQVAYINVTSWIRRTWMFIRLYFLAYLISEDHTFLRYGLVALAVLASLASGTEYPQMIYNAVMGPVHRHIEYLIPLDNNPGEQRAEAGGSETVNAVANSVEARQQQQQQGRGNGANASGSRLGSWERSVALYMATLIPGIGEPQFAARLAAREAAEARQMAEALRREQENRQQEQQRQEEQRQDANNEVTEPSSDCDTRESVVDSGATTGRELTDSSNQSRSRRGGVAEAPNL